MITSLPRVSRRRSDGAALSSDLQPGAYIVPGHSPRRWQGTLDANASLPRRAISGIRLYERYFYLFT
jgi:hypothetical protein